MESRPEKFTLFIGENGAGKSTMLKAIATSITGPRNWSRLVPDARQWITDGKDKGKIQAEIQKSSDDPSWGSSSESNIMVTLNFDKSSRSIIPASTGDFPDEGWFAAGYGPFRVPPSLGERTEINESYSYEDPRTSRLINLFQPRSKLLSLDSWLKELDWQGRRGVNSSVNVFTDALPKLFPPDFKIQFYDFDKEGFAIFSTPYGKTNLDGLSDGYRSMMIWVADILKNMMLAFPNSTNPLNSSGILILDEVDVHLHPRWQREIVSHLMKFFPNLQIITTTHSPLVLQGVIHGRVVGCRKGGDKVELDDSLPSVEGWRADEILEDKEFFRVNVYDEKTQKQLDDHERLLAKSKRSPEEDNKLVNLTQELRSKRVVGSSISDIDHQRFKLLSKQLEALKREDSSRRTSNASQ